MRYFEDTFNLDLLWNFIYIWKRMSAWTPFETITTTPELVSFRYSLRATCSLDIWLRVMYRRCFGTRSCMSFRLKSDNDNEKKGPCSAHLRSDTTTSTRSSPLSGRNPGQPSHTSTAVLRLRRQACTLGYPLSGLSHMSNSWVHLSEDASTVQTRALCP